MGWTHIKGATHSTVINEIVSDYSDYKSSCGNYQTRMLDNVINDNVMYALMETKGKSIVKRWILVVLFESLPGTGWGFKIMDENVGPCYYDCPTTFINRCTAPEPDTFAENWRKKVLAHNKRYCGRLI